MADDSARVRSLFLLLADKNPQARGGLLDEHCGGDLEFRSRVEALLKEHDMAGSPPELSDSTAGSEGSLPATRDHVDPTARVGSLLSGRYKLVEEIGSGGMGSVFLARQTEPVTRVVAVKVVKAGMDSRAVLARFDAERQALALMDHPNIAKVLDAGATDAGRPFFVMELVRGAPITEFCDERKMTLRQRLELFVPVCQAIQHAHQKGIIHRDIKPSNVLVGMYDDRAVPKVIDFGVAKAAGAVLTDLSVMTGLGAVVGTPEYMSPEQAQLSNLDIDSRSDVYALGVLLFELLTGVTPVDRATLQQAALLEILRRVREEEAPRPSAKLSTLDALPRVAANRNTEPGKLCKLLAGELDWVALKALEKDRTRRYETANALARDVQRYLADELVEARPPSHAYRLGKLLRRNRGTVAAAAAVLLSLIAGMIALMFGMVRAETARQAELKHRQRAEKREEQAIHAVKRFGDAVANNPELKNNPALTSLRKTLLKEPLEYFKSLRRELQADDNTRPATLTRLADAAKAHAQLSFEIGDRNDALQAFQQSLEVLERLSRDNPQDEQLLFTLAICREGMGVVQGELGQLAQSLDSHFEARRIWERLARLRGGDLDVTLNFVDTLIRTANVQYAANRRSESIATLVRAEDVLTELPPAQQRVTRVQDALANVRHNLGCLQLAGDEAESAAATFAEVAELLAGLLEQEPSQTDYQDRLAACQVNLALSLASTGRAEEAAEIYLHAIEARENLVRDHPTVVAYQDSLAHAYSSQGELYRAIGRPMEALASFNESVDIAKKLAAEHPESPDFASDVGATLNNIASIDGDAKRFEAARDRLQEAIVWQKKALAINPRHPVYRQFLANHYLNLMRSAYGLSDADLAAEARRHLQDLQADGADDN